MHRRSLVAAVAGVVTGIQTGLTGCLDAPGIDAETPTAEPGQDDRRFEQCDALVVSYEQLPDLAKGEVEIALADGKYEEDDRLHLADAVDVDRSYLNVDGRNYRIEVTDDDGANRLELEQATPELESPAALALDNQLDESPEIRVAVEREANEDVVVDYEEVLTPGATRELGTVSQFGGYTVRVVVDDRAETFTFRIDETSRDVTFRLTPDGVAFEQTETDRPSCPWE